MKFLLRLLFSACTLLLLTYYLPGIRVDSFYVAILAAIVLGLVNAIIRPIIVILTLPVNLLTLGLFSFVINAGLFWFVSTVVKGFYVDGFITALWGSLVISLVNWVSNMFLKR